MKASEVLQLVLQIIAMFPALEPAFVRAVEDFKKLFDDGAEPTQADIDVMLARIKEQSATIQAL